MDGPPVNRISGCGLKARLIFSSIGVFVGLSVCVVFCIEYKNYNTGLWGLMSGIAAGIALGVTIAYYKNVWDSNPSRLKLFMLLGCLTQLCGICGFVAYIVLGVSNKQHGFVIYGEDYYLTSVWCIMTLKWGCALLFYSKAFLRSYTEGGRLLNDDSDIAKKTYS